MSCLSRVSHYTATILGRTATPRLVSRPRPNLNLGPSSLAFFPSPSSFSNQLLAAAKPLGLVVRCYSSGASKKKTKSKKAAKLVVEEEEAAAMEPPKEEKENDSFFVVRKGDVVGVYKSFTDCQAQAGTSVCDPAVSVYKGYGLPKEAEEYLLSHGLHNALYTIRAADLKDDLFGPLQPCPFQQPSSDGGQESENDGTKKRTRQGLEWEVLEGNGSTSTVVKASRKNPKLDSQMRSRAIEIGKSCILEFDGASKGNPGQAGAGAVLRAADGSLICRLREGLGVATNNVAEYRAMILGLKYALQNGFTEICVRGDSKLVCMQIQGLWKVRHENMAKLCEQAKALKDKFISFQIGHVLRVSNSYFTCTFAWGSKIQEYNSEADAQANLAVGLADGQVQEELVRI